MSIVNQQVTKAKTLFQHKRPEDLEGDEYGDITAASGRQIGQLHQYFINQHAYMLQTVAEADQQVTIAEYMHSVIKKKAYIRLDNGTQKYKIDNAVAQDEDVQKAWIRVLEKRAYKDMTETITKGVESKAQMLSREITRRASERQ